MSTEFFTQVDIDAAKRLVREEDARARVEAGAQIIRFATLVDDMIRFMPEGVSGEYRVGYVEAVRDLFLQIGGCTLEHSAEDGSLGHSPSRVSVPTSRVDDALERRAERGRGA